MIRMYTTAYSFTATIAVTFISFLCNAPVRAQIDDIHEPGHYSSEKNYHLARTSFDDNDFVSAKKYLDAAIYRRKQYPEALFLRAMTKERLQDTLGSLTDYNALLYLRPDHAEALYARGTVWYALGQYQMAIKDFESALHLPVTETRSVYYKTLPTGNGTIGMATISTMCSEILNYIGLCHLQVQNTNKAIAFFDSVFRHQEPTSAMLINRGRAQELSGNVEKAAEDYQRALAIEPDNQTALFNLSNLFNEAGQTKDAILQINQIIANGNDVAQALNQRGLYHYHQGEFEMALSDFDSALTISPPDPGLFFNRGLAYTKTGGVDLAIADFDRCIQLDPSHAKAYQARGAARITKKQYKDALYDLNKAIAKEGAFGIAYYNRAVVKLYLRQKESACLDLENAKELGIPQATELLSDICTSLSGRQHE